MNIVIINGSHRNGGNCSAFADYLKRLLCANHRVNVINLIQNNILPCNGCLICEEGEACHINDDFSSVIQPLLEDSDLIVFATPTYFNMPSAQMVNFIDRTNNMCDYFAQNHKKYFCYLTGQTDEETIMEAYNCLCSYAEIMEMTEISDPIINIVRMPEQISNDIQEKIKGIVKLLS